MQGFLAGLGQGTETDREVFARRSSGFHIYVWETRGKAGILIVCRVMRCFSYKCIKGEWRGSCEYVKLDTKRLKSEGYYEWERDKMET